MNTHNRHVRAGQSINLAGNLMNKNMPASVLVKSQSLSWSRCGIALAGYPGLCDLYVQIRHDDRCGNGHNSFAITSEIYRHKKPKTDRNHLASGMLHEEIVKAFPQLKPYLKWHLCSTDQPPHYVANSLYFAIHHDLENARACAIWPDAKLSDFTAENLEARLPALMREFKKAVGSLRLIY